MTTERKRPWYLVLALLGALALGTTSAYGGWELAMLYHGTLDPSLAGRGITDEHERELAVSRAESAIRELDAVKSRGWPLAVATILVGGATMLFAMRALGGNGSARAALVQLVVAQAGVGVGGHFVLRQVLEPDLRAASGVVLALRTLASALVVVGLTRRGSREYFDSITAAVEER